MANQCMQSSPGVVSLHMHLPSAFCFNSAIVRYAMCLKANDNYLPTRGPTIGYTIQPKEDRIPTRKPAATSILPAAEAIANSQGPGSPGGYLSGLTLFIGRMRVIVHSTA